MASKKGMWTHQNSFSWHFCPRIRKAWTEKGLRSFHWHFRVKNTPLLAFRWPWKSRKSHSCAVQCLHLFSFCRPRRMLNGNGRAKGWILASLPSKLCPGDGYTPSAHPQTSHRIPTIKWRRWSSVWLTQLPGSVFAVLNSTFGVLGVCLRLCRVLQKYKMSEILRIKS